jgi:hypothetical protein
MANIPGFPVLQTAETLQGEFLNYSKESNHYLHQRCIPQPGLVVNITLNDQELEDG